MAKKKAAPAPTVDEAIATIDALMLLPQVKWERQHWDQFRHLIATAPEGLPPERFALILDRLINVRDLAHHLSPHVDEGVLLAFEEWEREKEGVQRLDHRIDAVFILTGLRAGKMTPVETRNVRLRSLISQTGMLRYLGWNSTSKFRVTREGAAASAERGDIVAGAQAAVAITPFTQYVTSIYVPVLLGDASDDSLDILLPFIEHTLSERGAGLDWMRRQLVPILANKPKANRLIEMVSEALDVRAAMSPARTFASDVLGMTPPPATLKFTVSFPSASNPVGPFQVRVDSTQSLWSVARRNHKWQYRSVDLEKDLPSLIPKDVTGFTLRVTGGKTTDRAKIEAWIKRTLMPPSAD